MRGRRIIQTMARPFLRYAPLFLLAVLSFTTCVVAPRPRVEAIPPTVERFSWSAFETAKGNGRRLEPIRPPAAAAELDPSSLIEVSPDVERQEILGFGGALTESSAWCLDQLDPEARLGVLRAYFDPKEGLRYKLGRTHINSCDFSLGTWSLDDTPDDVDLEHFSLEPMRRHLLPLLKDARAASGGTLGIIAAPWSPPAWMKTNGSMRFGGRLKPEYRSVWADYLVRYAKAMRDEEGIPLWALSMQNEPANWTSWESCLWSAEEARDFIKNYLGPALQSAGLGSQRLLVWDFNRVGSSSWAPKIYDDPAAAVYAWGAAVHWYGHGPGFTELDALHRRYSDKPILFTEGCVEGKPRIGRWESGERYARNMIGDFRNWVVAWIDWNIVLDTRGGPNHTGNYCDAPVIVDVKSGEVHYETSFYCIGHFSKFVDPGARCLESTVAAGLESVSFRNPDGSIVTVVLNEGGEARRFTLRIAGEAGEYRSCEIPARAIQTYIARPFPAEGLDKKTGN